MLSKPTKSILFIAPLFILGILFLYSLISQPERLNVTESIHALSMWPWAEGESKVTSHSLSENEATMTYTLDNATPYAGFSLTKNDGSYWDISQYDYIDIELDTERCGTFQLSLSFFLDGFSDLNRWQSLRVAITPIYNTKEKQIRIPIRDIHTPIWWYRENNVQAADVPDIDYTQLINIGFVNGEDQLPKEKQIITITSVSFAKNENGLSAIAATLLGIYALALILWAVFRKRTIALPTLNRINVGNYSDEEYERIASFMGEQFSRKDLTAGVVAENTGVTSAKISNLLHSYRGQSYNQFLNTLRIDEAKRLLRETDRNVSDISSLVGYSYVNSFNRVFKEFEKRTPLEYRSSQAK